MRVLIIGATGQDGSLLAEKYSAQGHLVLGVVSPQSRYEFNRFETLSADLSIKGESRSVLESFKPNRIFHVAAVHSTSVSSKKPNKETLEKIYSCNVEITQNILDWQRFNLESKSIIALSSQMYSNDSSGKYVDETSIFSPRNYYAETKVEALSLIKKYRTNYGTHSSGAILFNHTSNRSKQEFLFPQLAKEILQVLNGVSSKIVLHDPDAELDICDANEVSIGLMRMAELNEPTEIIFASGKSISIGDLITATMRDLSFAGDYTIERQIGNFVSAPSVVGNPEKAFRYLNWRAVKSPAEILLTMINQSRK
jgi:GDPmannose 4,6-dehydratase